MKNSLKPFSLLALFTIYQKLPLYFQKHIHAVENFRQKDELIAFFSKLGS